jgi:hypothetical protein
MNRVPVLKQIIDKLEKRNYGVLICLSISNSGILLISCSSKRDYFKGQKEVFYLTGVVFASSSQFAGKDLGVIKRDVKVC